LSKNWVEAGDDGSHEFALAASVASLATATDSDFRMPFRRHVAPLAWPKGRESWDDSTESQALAVWTGRNLVRDMAAVLERRLIEAQRHSFAHQDRVELPLRGRRWAPVAAVRAFITGNTEEGRPIDDERIASLATGLAWAREWPPPASAHARTEIFLPPLAFATIKPLFDPSGVAIPRPLEARIYGREDDRLRKRKAVDPLTLFRLVRGGRGAWSRASDNARRLAVGAGLSSPFGQASLNDDPDRFAAALLFPLGDADIEKLADRAYPNLTRDDEEPYAN
jgi:CRISPR-associated protein Csx17